jgi:hypothetical protein
MYFRWRDESRNRESVNKMLCIYLQLNIILHFLNRHGRVAEFGGFVVGQLLSYDMCDAFLAHNAGQRQVNVVSNAVHSLQSDDRIAHVHGLP